MYTPQVDSKIPWIMDEAIEDDTASFWVPVIFQGRSYTSTGGNDDSTLGSRSLRFVCSMSITLSWVDRIQNKLCWWMMGFFLLKKISPKMTQLQEISSLLLGDVKIQHNSTLVLAPLNFLDVGCLRQVCCARSSFYTNWQRSMAAWIIGFDVFNEK